jgi:uncharacterized membrane protein
MRRWGYESGVVGWIWTVLFALLIVALGFSILLVVLYFTEGPGIFRDLILG